MSELLRFYPKHTFKNLAKLDQGIVESVSHLLKKVHPKNVLNKYAVMVHSEQFKLVESLSESSSDKGKALDDGDGSYVSKASFKATL